MTLINRPVDTLTAYGRSPSTCIREPTEVGSGTRMGELLRRYWHPVGLTSDATNTPKAIRVLGEDFVLLRDGRGRPGLVDARCSHRGTTLYYGKVVERGIRCCDHGWLFDVEGRCLDQPCEPEHGKARHTVRQPWYPVQEHYGLVFAYMGPPERRPVLPRYECLDVLGPGEFVESDANSVGGGGPAIIPCNWMQHFENLADLFHVPILHGSFSGVQWRMFRRISEAVLPTLRIIPNPRVGQYGRIETIGWVLPIDDTSFRIYTAGRVRRPGEIVAQRSKLNGKLWEHLTEEEHQRFPGDYEAHVGQGPITHHSEENLATSDLGVVRLRRLFRRQLDEIAEGRDPIGVSFDEERAFVKFEAGNYLAAA